MENCNFIVKLKLLVFYGTIVCWCCCHGAFAEDDMSKSEAMSMLKKYNYMGEGNPDPKMNNDSMYGEALMMFQMVAGLNQTGELDEATAKMMKAPRCGFPDFTDKGDMMKRKKRYELAGSKWFGGLAGYNFISYPTQGGLTPSEVRATITRAFSTWAEVAGIRFQEMDKRSDIEISFVSGDHDDGFPLDGPGSVLAHAFFPNPSMLGGDMHFDNDEVWSINSHEATDLYYVALHELGHSLGLKHSLVTQSAVMYPWYPGYLPDLKLHQDDIDGIQQIYGPKETAPEPTHRPWRTTTPSVPGPSYESFCNNGYIDAIGTLGGNLYAFQGNTYALLDDSGIRPGYPKSISSDWGSLPSDIDAALTWGNDDILLLFKDTQYWRYKMGSDGMPVLQSGYPRTISDDFTNGLPSTVDAAFVWGRNGRTYIINDEKYSRVRKKHKINDDRIRAKCDHFFYAYPKNFAKHWNIDVEVNDVLVYDGRTYFFSGKDYYRYNDRSYEVDPGYPKSVAGPWFGCRNPGELKAPKMEMDMMKQESQFEEIRSSLNDVTSDSSSTPLLSFASLLCCLVFTLLLK